MKRFIVHLAPDDDYPEAGCGIPIVRVPMGTEKLVTCLECIAWERNYTCAPRLLHTVEPLELSLWYRT